MKLLMLAKTDKEYRIFLEAWEEFTRMVMISDLIQDTKSKIGNVQVKGIFYIGNNPVNPSEVYTFDLLESQQQRINSKSEGAFKHVYDCVFVLGSLPQQEMIHFTKMLQRKIVNKVFVCDITMSNKDIEVAHIYYPMITYSKYCSNPEYDVVGLVKDLVMFFFGSKGVDKFYPQREQRIS